MECVNLKTTFGKRYRVTREESYGAEHGAGAWREDAWLQIIELRRGRGHIYPHGGDTLGASLEGNRPQTVRKLLALGCEMFQDGDDGATLLFPVEKFDQVAEVVDPKQRPQYSPEVLERKREAARRLNHRPTDGSETPRRHVSSGVLDG